MQGRESQEGEHLPLSGMRPCAYSQSTSWDCTKLHRGSSRHSARVGCSVADGDVWRGVRGQHGVGCCNEAGEMFLEFCAVNQFTIMNTGFTKKSIHLAT